MRVGNLWKIFVEDMHTQYDTFYGHEILWRRRDDVLSWTPKWYPPIWNHIGEKEKEWYAKFGLSDKDVTKRVYQNPMEEIAFKVHEWISEVCK